MLGKLGRRRFPYGEPQVVCTDHLSPGFFPLNLTGFVLASPGELCILRTHLYGADQAPLSSAVERREVAGAERWVDVLERMWGLHGISLYPLRQRTRFAGYWYSCLHPNQCSVALGIISNSVVSPLVLSSSSASGAGWWCCRSSMFLVQGLNSKNCLWSFVVLLWGAVGILQSYPCADTLGWLQAGLF